MTVLDPGHLYKLQSYDGDIAILLQFMKRTGEGYPGNNCSYTGTNCQEVIRVLIDRVKYLNGQVPDPRNTKIISMLRHCLYWFEERAADRHGRPFSRVTFEIEKYEPCKTCGHLDCEHLEEQWKQKN